MSEADKMFEDLGYEKYDGHIICDKNNPNVQHTGDIYFKKYNEELTKYIFFDFNLKTFGKVFLDNNYKFNSEGSFHISELQAINKKCEEDGWI